METLEPPRKRQRLSQEVTPEDEPTDVKLAILASLYPDRSEDVLLDYLLAYNGSVDDAIKALSATRKKDSSRKAITGYQSSLMSFTTKAKQIKTTSFSTKPLTKKGRTLHLFV